MMQGILNAKEIKERQRDEKMTRICLNKGSGRQKRGEQTCFNQVKKLD